MIKTIKIGEKEVTLKSSAATNILYKKTFGEDIIVKLSDYTKNLKELKNIQKEANSIKEDPNKTEEEKLEAMKGILNSEAFIATQAFANETLPKLAYVMFLEATETEGTIFSKLTSEKYLGWLMSIEQDELLSVTGEVMNVWQAGAKTHSKPKN